MIIAKTTDFLGMRPSNEQIMLIITYFGKLGFLALKGLNIPAQGNALGYDL